MPSLQSGFIVRASGPKDSERTKLRSKQLLDNSKTVEQLNHVDTQPEEGPELATELPTSAARVIFEAPCKSQQSDIPERPTYSSADVNVLFLEKPNEEAAFDEDWEIDVFLDNSLLGDITPTTTSASDDRSIVHGSQAQQDADHWPLILDCHSESRDESACDSASSQTPLDSRVQAANLVASDNPKPGQAFLEVTDKDIGSAIIRDKDIEEISRPDSATATVDEHPDQRIKPASKIVIIEAEQEQMAKPDSVMNIIDDDTEQTTTPRRNSRRNAAKRSFKEFVVSDSLWMGQISEDLDGIMKLTEYVLTTSEKVVKKAKIIKDQLIASQKYIRNYGSEEMKVTKHLGKL